MSEELISSPVIEGREDNSDLSNEWVDEMVEIRKLECGIPIFSFQEAIKSRKQDMEFRVIRKITETTKHNSLLHDYSPETNKLNRYNNIIPFKHSIVKLPVCPGCSRSLEELDEDLPPSESSQYINANYINDCFKRQKVFIATQGPMKNTACNFWRMVWHSDVKIVIMLCRLVEQERIECDQYWPDSTETPLVVGPFEIILTEETTREADKLVIRKFIIHSRDESHMPAQKTCIQYHWLGWPDHGVPDDDSFDVLEEMVNLLVHSAEMKQKTLVHCSAGVGRTGTILSLVNLTMTLNYFASQLAKKEKALNSLEKDDKYRISIFGVVRRLREQRWGMVYTNVQYNYLYKYMEQAIKKMISEL